jgi:superfamily II DNA or RNA helicase
VLFGEDLLEALERAERSLRRKRARAERACPLDRWLRALVTVPKALDRLRGSGVFAVAAYLAGKHVLSIDTALEALVRAGLPASEDRHRLADRMRQSMRANHYGTWAVDRDRFAFASRSALRERLEGLRLSIEEDDPTLGAAVAGALDKLDKRPPSDRTPALSTRSVSTPMPAASPPPAPAPALPEPPPAPPPVPLLPIVAPMNAELLVSLLGRAPVELTRAAHALEAQTLASAEQFDELLAPPRLRGVESHRHQLDTVRRVLRVLRGRALLADEVGLGKTVEALMILREYQLRGMVRRALVLVPAALLAQWEAELVAKADIAVRTTESAALRTEPDTFWGAEGVVVSSLATARNARHAASVQAVDWDMVIVDEAHHVKNRTTLGYKFVDGLRTRFLLLVTATPVENDLDELYSLVTLLRAGQLTTPAAFRREFVDPKDPTAPRNRDKLRALLGEVMVRNTRAQSGLKLPPRYVTTVLAEPLEAEAALYARVLDLVRAHGREPALRRAASTLLLEAGSSPHAVRGTLGRMANGGAQGAAAGWAAAIAALDRQSALVTDTRKSQMLVDIAETHRDEQILVFTRYRDTLAHIEGALGRAGVAHAVFHGGLGATEKSEAMGAFRQGRARVLVATGVGAEGQNVQFCHVLVNFDLPWNPMVIEQRIGRLHRIGQTHEVRVYNLALRATIEERVLDVLDRRLHLFELVVGEMDMVLGNIADERDLEERILGLYAQAATEADIDRGFETIARELETARGRYERARELDAALFGDDYES